MKTAKAENESSINQLSEEAASLKRELAIKARQCRDLEGRTNKATDELDLFRFKVQETQKDNTELKLKIDVLNSTVNGLASEKQHLSLELGESKELLTIFENKTKELMADLLSASTELQENKREMIGFSEVQKERE